MEKTGYLFKCVCSSDTTYVISRNPDLAVFGETLFPHLEVWERQGQVELSPEGLRRFVVSPQAALRKLEADYWYLTSHEDERHIYFQN
jgi:hypothetical protein